MKGPVLQFPVAFGAITVSYNLPGVKSGLKLDGPTLANIFLGKIKTWNDPAIKALNPGMSLPSTAITVVHRSDSSGTTNGFTTYLSDVQPDVERRRSAPARTSSGRSAPARRRTPASRRRSSRPPARSATSSRPTRCENGFTYAAVKNSSGSYVLPTIPNTSAAADGIKVPADLGISTINSPNPAAYPIVSQTFLDRLQGPVQGGRRQLAVAQRR